MRPIASLSPSLLARKGQARPAMRPPVFGGVGTEMAAVDDLGWNDMGAAEPAPEPEPVALPPVLVARAALTDEVARIASVPADTAVVAASPVAPRAGRAAFTLRLPPERHLRLRLASAVTRRSAQGLVTEALDAFLSTLPEVEALAARCTSPDQVGTPE